MEQTAAHEGVKSYKTIHKYTNTALYTLKGS